jgi:DNA-binding MarR family transcriptional regulator
MDSLDELRFLILAAQREGNRVLLTALRPLGLTPAQAEVLRVLHDFEPLTLAELGELLVCETGSPSRLTDGMVQRGLIRRAPSKRDGRAVQLQLTPAGRKAAVQTTGVEAALKKRIAGLIEPKRAEAFVQMLRVLVAGSSGGDAVAKRRTRTKRKD